MALTIDTAAVFDTGTMCWGCNSIDGTALNKLNFALRVVTAM